MEVKEPSDKYLAQAGYKQTDVGVIPEDWECHPLGTFSLVSSGGTPSRKVPDYWGSDIPWVTTAEIDFNTVRGSAESISSLGLKNSAAKLLQPGTLLMALYGQGKTRGKVALLDIDAATNQACASIAVDAAVSRSYVYHFLASSYETIRALSNSGSQDNLTAQIVKAINVPLPPTKEEQGAIAEALGDAGALIEALEGLLAKKRQIKQGALQELLTGQRRLPGFAGEWRARRLGDSAVLKARIGWQGLTTAEYKKSGDFYLVTGTELSNGYIEWSKCSFIDEPRYRQDRNIQLRIHDVLVTKDGTIGKVALIDHLPLPATLNSGVFVIRPIDDAFHPEFFYHLLCSEQFSIFLGQLSAGSTINHLYQKDFVEFVFKTPATIEEQTAIATALSDMDAEIAALEGKLAKVRELKQGMMQELLTGRIRLV